MSFLVGVETVVKDIGIGVGLIAPFAPVLSVIPGFGPVFATVWAAVTFVEKLIPQKGQGQVRRPIAHAIVLAVHPQIDQSALDKAIDKLVAALNELAKLEQVPATA